VVSGTSSCAPAGSSAHTAKTSSKTILRLASTRDELRIVADQFGAPTGAALLADASAHLAARYLRESGEDFPQASTTSPPPAKQTGTDSPSVSSREPQPQEQNSKPPPTASCPSPPANTPPPQPAHRVPASTPQNSAQPSDSTSPTGPMALTMSSTYSWKNKRR
jgi:hypothetical protein